MYLHPILSMTDAAYQVTARWLVKMLEPVGKQIVKHTLRDSLHFVEGV